MSGNPSSLTNAISFRHKNSKIFFLHLVHFKIHLPSINLFQHIRISLFISLCDRVCLASSHRFLRRCIIFGVLETSIPFYRPSCRATQSTSKFVIQLPPIWLTSIFNTSTTPNSCENILQTATVSPLSPKSTMPTTSRSSLCCLQSRRYATAMHEVVLTRLQWVIPVVLSEWVRAKRYELQSPQKTLTTILIGFCARRYFRWGLVIKTPFSISSSASYGWNSQTAASCCNFIKMPRFPPFLNQQLQCLATS